MLMSTTWSQNVNIRYEQNCGEQQPTYHPCKRVSRFSTLGFWQPRQAHTLPPQEGYLCSYTQTCHNWSDKVWDMINMTAVGLNFKAIPLKRQSAHLKVIHHQLPLGYCQYQSSTVKDEHLKLCPMCQSQKENINHFLHCTQNPTREKSI